MTGSSHATSVTKSQPPRGPTSSRSRVTSARSRGSSARITLARERPGHEPAMLAVAAGLHAGQHLALRLDLLVRAFRGS
jgi:hypothetical protein